MHIVILGAGFASLKIATLLSNDSNESKDCITLISNTREFVFLPLIPNLLDESLKRNTCDIFINLEKFCLFRGIKFINKVILDNDIKASHIVVEGKREAFDLLFDAEGSKETKILTITGAN